MRLSYAETREPPRWMPLVHAIQRFHPTRVEHFQSKCFTMESNPNHLTYVHVRTWKGRSKRLFFSKLDPACIRESRSHPRERERERFLVFTLVILRAISLYSGRTSGKGRGRSWRRSENRGREERNVEYDGAAVKQTGMLQNQYLLDTRRYSTLNASLVTRACTNTRMPLTLCPPLLCDTAEAAVATFRSLHLYIRKTVVSRPETWISFSIIPAR